MRTPTKSLQPFPYTLGSVFGIRNRTTRVAQGELELWHTKVKVYKIMKPDSKAKKKPYSPPTVAKLTPEQAKQFVAHRTNCSDQEAADFLESLRREQPRNEEQSQNDANDDKRKRSA
jgi:hypothetical protein